MTKQDQQHPTFPRNQIVNVLSPTNVSPSGKFNFIAAGTWPQWRKRSGRCMTVLSQNAKSKEEKINMLVNIMSEEAEEMTY